jgi:hypothetical protein
VPAKKIRIYISSNRGLPNLSRSLSALVGRITASGMPKDRLQIIDAGPMDFEYPALNRLWLDSHDEDFYALYLHCKGSSKIDEVEFQNGLAWMHYMAVGVIDNYLICLKHLDQGADLVGSMWYRHFKGNFFWAKSSYLRTLVGPYHIDVSNRFNAEYWCSQAYWYSKGLKLPKVKNLFYLPITADDQFLPLLKEGQLPNFYERVFCPDLIKAKASGNYMIYDDIVLNGEPDEDVAAYSNYNSNFYLCPPRK